MTEIQPILPVVHYQFGCNQDGEAQVIVSGPLMDTLDENLGDGPLCHAATNGIVSPTVLRSNATIQELQQVSQDAVAFALEVWFTLLEGIDISSPLLAFGGPEYQGLLDEGCGGFQVALAYRQSQIELRYVEESDFEDNCRILVVREVDLFPLDLHQVVALLTNGQTSLYMDGIPIVRGAPNHFDPTLSNWDPNLTLQLLDQGMGASLSMFSIYNENLTDADVLDLHKEGLLRLAPTNRDPLHLHILEAPSIRTSSQGEPTSLRLIPGYQLGSGETPVPNEWSLMVEFTTLPLYGSLLDATNQENENRTIQLNDRIALENIESVRYQPTSVTYFNSPSFTFDGTILDTKQEQFSYRLIALSRDESSPQLLASSEIAQLQVIVIHINHAPNLHAPEEAVVSENQTTGAGARPSAFLEGIELLDDLDFNIDRVRVDIWTYNGTLKLAHPELADFATCRANERQALLGNNFNWSCFGDGMGNRNMTFVATPDNVTMILSRVEYSGFYWEHEDQVVIRIYDGEGGQCLTQKEHRRVQYQGDQYHTLHNDECFYSMATISVPPVHFEAYWGSYMRAFFDLDDFGVADALFWGFMFLLLVTCCVSIRFCIRCFGTRGAKIGIADRMVEDQYSV